MTTEFIRTAEEIKKDIRTVRMYEMLDDNNLPTNKFCVEVSRPSSRPGFKDSIYYYPTGWGENLVVSSVNRQNSCVVAGILDKIASIHGKKDMQSALKFLEKQGDKGIKMTLTPEEWQKIGSNNIKNNYFVEIPKPTAMRLT